MLNARRRVAYSDYQRDGLSGYKLMPSDRVHCKCNRYYVDGGNDPYYARYDHKLHTQFLAWTLLLSSISADSSEREDGRVLLPSHVVDKLIPPVSDCLDFSMLQKTLSVLMSSDSADAVRYSCLPLQSWQVLGAHSGWLMLPASNFGNFYQREALGFHGNDCGILNSFRFAFQD